MQQIAIRSWAFVIHAKCKVLRLTSVENHYLLRSAPPPGQALRGWFLNALECDAHFHLLRWAEGYRRLRAGSSDLPSLARGDYCRDDDFTFPTYHELDSHF
jgi:hypothetical protein